MAKYLITHPVKDYGGIFLGVQFTKGKAELDTATTSHLQPSIADSNEQLIEKLKAEGCQVQELRAKKGEAKPVEEEE